MAKGSKKRKLHPPASDMNGEDYEPSITGVAATLARLRGPDPAYERGNTASKQDDELDEESGDWTVVERSKKKRKKNSSTNVAEPEADEGSSTHGNSGPG